MRRFKLYSALARSRVPRNINNKYFMISDTIKSAPQTQVRLKGEQESDRESLQLQSRLIDEECIECGLCSKDCLFLQKYGTPKEIAVQSRASRDFLSLSFECSLCGLCTAVCSVKILFRKRSRPDGHSR